MADPRPTLRGRDGRDLPAWLTVRELAELTGVTDRAVRKACATGRIRGWTVARGLRRDWIVPLAEAEAWARSRRPLTADAVLAATRRPLM